MISEYVPNAAALTSRATTTVSAKLPRLYSSWSTIPMPARRRPPRPGRCSGNVEVRRGAEVDEVAAGRRLGAGGEGRVEVGAPPPRPGPAPRRGASVRP